MKLIGKRIFSMAFLLLLFIFHLLPCISFARVGGAGGHSSGGHSGGGGYHGYSSHGFSGGGYSDGSGSGGVGMVIAIIIVVIVLVIYSQNQKKNGLNREDDIIPAPRVPGQPFPQGLDPEKVSIAFMGIQNAWQAKDLSEVRKWLSDGMYQRLSTQFKMMNILGQKNVLDNIRITNIRIAGTHTDGHYQTADVAISFVMDDSFVSDKYPQFNEAYDDDADTEFWTFIMRTDSTEEKNLYDNNNCPNCGAPFEVKMGEISRCANCNTLTNSAAYDWVLSEITQYDDYNGGAGLRNDANLLALMKNDPFFSVQGAEDIASNIFMQIMEVFTIGDPKLLKHFADDEIAAVIIEQKKKLRPFVFDRLYLNDVTLRSYQLEADIIKLYFDITAAFRRVSVEGGLHMLDGDFTSRIYGMELSRSRELLAKPGEIVFSYECASCGAPFTDTTGDHCTYCDAPVIDKKRNWVLTNFVTR